MQNKSQNPQQIFISEEEKTINWEIVQKNFDKIFGREVYNSWLKDVSLIKEFNDYIILGVPTRFFRDWIVSRYLDKILELIKGLKKSIIRIEFKIVEDVKSPDIENLKADAIKNITEIKDSVLNYNRLNPNLTFENFVQGKSNEIALSYSKRVCEDISRYNPLYIYGGVGLGKTHLLNAIAVSYTHLTLPTSELV